MFGNKEKKEIRFMADYVENKGGGVTCIYVDTKTGVQYLFIKDGGGEGGLTPLIDKNGNPLLNEEYRNEE